MAITEYQPTGEIISESELSKLPNLTQVGEGASLGEGGKLYSPKGAGQYEVRAIPSTKAPQVTLGASPAASAINTSLGKLNEVLYARPGENYEQYEARLGSTPGGAVGTGFNLPKEKPPEPPKPPEGTTFIKGTTIPSTGDTARDEEIATHQERSKAYDAEVSSIISQMRQIRNGTYINPNTQSLIDNINQTYQTAIDAQRRTNEAVLAGVTQAGIRAGRARYAPEIETGNLNKVMQAGVDKISDILAKKAAAISKAQLAANQNDFNNLYKEMQGFEKHSADETKASLDILKEVQNEAKLAVQTAKAQAETTRIQEETEAKEAGRAAYTVFQYLESLGEEADFEETKKVVQEFAAQEGYDPDALLNEVEKLETTRNKFYGTGTMGEYNFAKDKGGFTGSYMDWLEYKRSIRNQSRAQKEFSFTPKQTLDLESRGLDKKTQQTILNDLQKGASGDAIRGEMKRNSIDPALLDVILGYIRPKSSPQSSSFK